MGQSIEQNESPCRCYSDNTDCCSDSRNTPDETGDENKPYTCQSKQQAKKRTQPLFPTKYRQKDKEDQHKNAQNNPTVIVKQRSVIVAIFVGHNPYNDLIPFFHVHIKQGAHVVRQTHDFPFMRTS